MEVSAPASEGATTVCNIFHSQSLAPNNTPPGSHSDVLPLAQRFRPTFVVLPASSQLCCSFRAHLHLQAAKDVPAGGSTSAPNDAEKEKALAEADNPPPPPSVAGPNDDADIKAKERELFGSDDEADELLNKPYGGNAGQRKEKEQKEGDDDGASQKKDDSSSAPEGGGEDDAGGAERASAAAGEEASRDQDEERPQEEENERVVERRCDAVLACSHLCIATLVVDASVSKHISSSADLADFYSADAVVKYNIRRVRTSSTQSNRSLQGMPRYVNSYAMHTIIIYYSKFTVFASPF
jgi:hypothetical protein